MERREDQGAALKEAEKAFKKGEASLKTGMFKWSAHFSEGQINIEKAAKAYKQLGDKPHAAEAFLRYSACCVALNENYGAADGLVQAAQLETDRSKAIQYLHKAQNFYKINGNSNTG